MISESYSYVVNNKIHLSSVNMGCMVPSPKTVLLNTYNYQRGAVLRIRSLEANT